VQQRRSNRYPFRAKAQVKAIDDIPPVRPIEASTRDLSRQGIYLDVDQDLSKDSQVLLTLDVPTEFGGPVVVDCVSRIVRVVKQGEGKVGVGAVIEKFGAFRTPEEEPGKPASSSATPLPKLIAMAEMTFGPKHPGAAKSLFNVARLYFSQGKRQEAITLCLRALGMDETAPGVKLTEVAQTLEDYADLLRKLQCSQEAEEMKARAGKLRTDSSSEQPV